MWWVVSRFAKINSIVLTLHLNKTKAIRLMTLESLVVGTLVCMKVVAKTPKKNGRSWFALVSFLGFFCG
jgi:hypothetical protein